MATSSSTPRRVAFARYARFGVPAPRWHHGHDVDGTRASRADKLAALEIPLTVEQARTAVQLTLRVHAPAPGRLELKVNGRKASKDARVDLAAGWQTIAVAIEPGRLVVGENLVMLESSVTGKTRAESPSRGSGSVQPRPLDATDPRARPSSIRRGRSSSRRMRR